MVVVRATSSCGVRSAERNSVRVAEDRQPGRSMCDRPPSPMSPSKRARHLIRLSGSEVALFDTITDVIKHFRLTTVVRVAGGWVRDKLLGFDCKDIDITVDDMNGVAFAKTITKYLEEVKGERVGRIGVIQANPDQSKHLETATFSFHGHDIDVNSLRTEVYSNTSRIPVIALGSAFEDAMRRDFTINSMFYNLNTKEVEDLTKKGIADLSSRIIRTPIDAMQTFKDDPLRALRAIRFAGRLNFSLCSELERALRDKTVQGNLFHKVSRERVGIEINKMFFDPSSNPILCAQHLIRYELYHPSCFALPDGFSVKECSTRSYDYISRAEGYLSSSDIKIDLHTRRLILFSCFLNPFVKEMHPGHRNKPQPFLRHIIVDNLKLSIDHYKQISHLLDNAAALSSITSESWEDPIPDAKVVKIGRALKAMGPKWKLVFHVGSILHPEQKANQDSLLEWLQSSDLKNIHNWQPLLNGKEMMQLLKVKGKEVGKVLDKQLDWQILHPHGTSSEFIDYISTQMSD